MIETHFVLSLVDFTFDTLIESPPLSLSLLMRWIDLLNRMVKASPKIFSVRIQIWSQIFPDWFKNCRPRMTILKYTDWGSTTQRFYSHTDIDSNRTFCRALIHKIWMRIRDYISDGSARLPGPRPVVALESITKTNGVGSDTTTLSLSQKFYQETNLAQHYKLHFLGKKIIQNTKPVLLITAVMTTWDRLQHDLTWRLPTYHNPPPI